MASRKNLIECRTESERRENWPDLYRIIDVVAKLDNPAEVLGAVIWCIQEDEIERQESIIHGK